MGLIRAILESVLQTNVGTWLKRSRAGFVCLKQGPESRQVLKRCYSSSQEVIAERITGASHISTHKPMPQLLKRLSRKPQNSRFLFLISIIILWCENDGFAQTGVFVPEMVNVDAVFSNFMNDWNIPGGSIAIVKDGRLVYARGFGYANKESQELVQPHHLFRIASISKPITSIAIMKLIDQGQLNIDAKVFGMDGILNNSDYSTILDSRVKNITVRHLLQHTSGWDFIDGRGDPMFYNSYIAWQMGEEPPVGPVTIIKFMLTTQTLDNEPGTQYFYSNFGFCILGRVIEQVSGQNYENYVKTELLNPLGISEMQVGRTLYENKAPNEVKYYNFPGSSLAYSIYGTGERVPWPYGGFHLEGRDANGGWIASAIDLVRLLVAVDGFDTKPDILSQSSIQLMTTSSNANSYYGLGWRVNRWNNWWHSGSLPGTSSILVRTANGLGWAVLFNTRPSNWRDFTPPMDKMVWEAIRGIDKWPTHDLFEQVISDARMPATLVKISGDKQEGMPSTELAMPLVVEVRDQNGEAITGISVTFAIATGGGVLSVETTTTDSSGQASSVLTLGNDLGTNSVAVTVIGIEQPVTFVVEAVATPDFDGDGRVGFPDFLLFGVQYGLTRNDEGYDARFDLDGDGAIGFSDLLIFANHFGKPVSS